jgi:hypothetical protein
MNQSDLSTLQHQVESVEMPAALRDSILQLINEHGTQQRAESFWSARAPAMNDELVILRQIETDARALLRVFAQGIDGTVRLNDTFFALEALRIKQAGA